MRAYSNQHLVEVVCNFHFKDNGINWDSAFFGQYFEKLKVLGFTAREERRGVRVDFGNHENETGPTLPVSAYHTESTMLFKDQSRGLAVTLGEDQISFHKVGGYAGWESFTEKIIAPGLSAYKDLGLLQGEVRCNIVYLNRLKIPVESQLSENFTFINPIGDTFGEEKSNVIERILYHDESTLLMLKFNSFMMTNGEKDVSLECGAFTQHYYSVENYGWEKLALTTHAPIRSFFEELITETLKQIL